MSNNFDSTSFFILIFFIPLIIIIIIIQVQEEFGDHPGGECRYLTGNLSKYLASKYMETTSATELEEHVLKLYSKLNGYSQEEARLSYLDYVKSWKIYGSSYYFAEPQNNKSFPPEVSVQLQCLGDPSDFIPWWKSHNCSFYCSFYDFSPLSFSYCCHIKYSYADCASCQRKRNSHCRP